MKQLITLLIAGGAMLSAALPAQTIEQANRPWEAGPLTWDEFLGTAHSDTTISEFAWNVRLDDHKLKVGNTTYVYPLFTPSFDQTESWVKQEFKNDAMLQYNQILFDMLELYTRRATRDYILNQDYSSSQVWSFYDRQFANEAQALKLDTRQGTFAARLPYHAASVALDLERTEFDPVNFIQGKSMSWNGAIWIGAGAMFPMSDYFKASYGFNVGMSAGYKRHVWEMDISLGLGSKAKEDFKTDNGWIDRGESLNVVSLYFNYGFITTRTSHLQAAPYLGLGFIGLVRPKEYKEEDVPEKYGFSVCAGMSFDVVLRRKAYIRQYVGSDNVNVNYSSLRLRPYFSLTRFDEFGWTPALNLSLSYNFGGYGLR